MLRRAIGTLPQAPWSFHQLSVPIPLRPLTALDQSLLPSLLPASFSYSYTNLLHSLCKHDYPSLTESLEGRLYHRVESLLKDIEFEGFHFGLIPTNIGEPKLGNVSMHLGVHLQRIHNSPSFQAFNLNFLKGSIDPKEFMKQKQEKGISPEFNLLEMDLGHIWAYIWA